MKKSLAHVNLAVNALWGIILKFTYKFRTVRPLASTKSTNLPIVVSLTSYGRRVEQTVYYTILSLFLQVKRPERIILWLDNINWSISNLPKKLVYLQQLGLEIRFIDDIKSYKKLIPTLQLCPNSIIVTVDDDVIYSRRLLEKLYESYIQSPTSIHATRASRIIFNDGIPAPYSHWLKLTSSTTMSESQDIVPIGIGGVLYPPNCLYRDVCNSELFMNLSPMADDLWFWAMSKLQNTTHVFVPLKNNFYSFDAFYQKRHRGSALTHTNVVSCNNDMQLKQILDYYKSHMD